MQKLRVNHLPTQPRAGETNAQYNQRLSQLLETLSNPTWVTGSDGSFKYHAQAFAFGPTEFAGLKIFLRAAVNATDGTQHAGNCAACHVAPDFTDFQFHNNGAAQEEYDAVNGAGAFAQLKIPGLAERNANFDLYMPVSANHPNASETFRHAAVAGNTAFADLGLWNVYMNPDIPNPQGNLSALIAPMSRTAPSIRGLPQQLRSSRRRPCAMRRIHSPISTMEANQNSTMWSNFIFAARSWHDRGGLRNAPVEFQGMSLSEDDVSALVAFLMSLTEDYDDA